MKLPHFVLKNLFNIQYHSMLMVPTDIMPYDLQKHADVLSHVIFLLVLGGEGGHYCHHPAEKLRLESLGQQHWPQN